MTCAYCGRCCPGVAQMIAHMNDEHPIRLEPTDSECSWCPSGCRSCTEDRDCECYTHQDEPDRHAPEPTDSDGAR